MGRKKEDRQAKADHKKNRRLAKEAVDNGEDDSVSLAHQLAPLGMKKRFPCLCLNVDSVRCHQIKLFHPMFFVSDREFSHGCARAVKRLVEENGEARIGGKRPYILEYFSMFYHGLPACLERAYGLL